MSFESIKLMPEVSVAPAAHALDPFSLGHGTAITQSASTLAGHLGSSRSSSSRSEAWQEPEPGDDSAVPKGSTEALETVPVRPPLNLPIARNSGHAPGRAPLPPGRGAPSSRNATPRGMMSQRTSPGTSPGASPRPSPRAGTPRLVSSRSGTPRSMRRHDTRERGDEGHGEEVKVIVRVRPPLEQDRPLAYFADESDLSKLVSTPVEGCVTPTGNRGIAYEEFGFSRVIAPHESNRQMFEALGLRELISGVSRGFQETVFAYGQTGSGKTHTILGSATGDKACFLDSVGTGVEPAGEPLGERERQERDEPGLLQLCTRELFNLVREDPSEKEPRRYIQLMCLELKNEEVIDLLPERPACVRAAQMTQETISVKGRRAAYRKVTTWSYEETMWLLRRAIASREVGSSSLNSESSRSHMVIRFFVKTLASSPGPQPPSSSPKAGRPIVASGVVGSLTLVDLAGNERESPSDNTLRKEEAKAINVSLTHLNRMLLKMQSGQLDESDRRQGTLNMVLYESLREDCGATMIFCIHPDQRSALSARSTLQMALRCRKIVRKKEVRLLEAAGYQSELADLRLEASALTQAHKQALEARMRKEEELQQTAAMLHELKHRYEEKSKDFELLRTNLENRYEKLAEEDQEKHRLVMDLERKEKRMQGMIEQLRCLEHQIAEKDRQQERRESEYQELQRRFEEADKRLNADTLRVGRNCSEEPRSRMQDDEAARIRELEMARARDAQGFENRCMELQKAYRNQLQSVRDNYERELRSLKDALRQRAPSEEAEPKHGKAACDHQALSASTPMLSSSGGSGEPCSEPSFMQSTRGASGDDEAFASAPLEGGIGESQSTVPQYECPQLNEACLPGEPATPPLPSLERIVTRRCRNTVAHAPSASEAATRRSIEQAATPQAMRFYSGSTKVQHDPSKLLEGLGSKELEKFETVLPHLCRSAFQGHIEEHLKNQCIDIGLQAMRFFPNSAKIQRDATKLLEGLGSKDAFMKTEIVQRGALGRTLDALRNLTLSSDQAAANGASPPAAPSIEDKLVAEACASCFRLLAVLCQRQPGHQVTVREAGGIDVVLRCLGTLKLRCGRDVAVNGVWLLMALVHKQPETQNLARTQNGIMLLLQLLDIEVSALETEVARRPLDTTRVVERSAGNLCCYIAGCLAAIADGNLANQQALYEVGGIHLLLRTLETCLQSPIVVGNACVAISHIAHRHEPSQHAARSQGAVKSILEALLAYRGHASVQGNICRAIAMLTEKNAANQQAFLAARLPDGAGETGALALLIQALRRMPGEVQMITHACWALANLVTSNYEAMDQVRVLDGLDSVVSLLGHLERKEHACEYICRLLTELARGDSLAAHRNREEFRTLGAKEAITAMMQHHVQSHGFVLVRARDALQHLATSVPVRRVAGTGWLK
mmetsp:Transcript_70269/g.132597  ORF Transcript_70269/g.132597 Transcript_70269/m.132597 type:complete len:1412 (+) Transcript_70269:188-4423(+)